MIKTLFFSLLIFVITAQAQNSVYEMDDQKREDLFRALETATTTEQAVIYNEISETYVYVDTNKTLDYARLALEKAEESADTNQMARAHRNLGTAYHIKGNFDSALKQLSEANQIKNVNDVRIKSDIKLALSLIYSYAEIWEPANELLEQAYQGFAKTDSEFDMARARLNQAKNALSRKQIARSIEYYEDAKSHARLSGSDRLDGHFHLIEGLLLIEQDRFQEAIRSLTLALEFFEANGFASPLCTALSNIAICYQKIGDFENSDRCANRCISEGNGLLSPQPVIDSYKVLSENAAQRGDFRLAYETTKNAQNIADTIRVVDIGNKLTIMESFKNINRESETQKALIATNIAQRWAILMATLLIVGVIILLVQLYRHNRSLRRLQQQEHDFSEQLKAKQDAIISRNRDLAEIVAHRDRLYSIIAHDLKSPIGALHGLMQTLTNEDLQKEETISIVRSLAPSVKSTFELIEQLVEWAQTQQMELHPKPETINLYQFYQSALAQIEPFLARKNITLIARIAINHEVFFDRGMLLSILRSLLSNAVKFTNQDGSIDIQSLPDHSGVSFKNSGLRIPQAVIDAINTNQTVESSFGTAGEKGTGLGLTIIKTLLEANGGAIEFKADATGSTAIVYLPQPDKQ